MNKYGPKAVKKISRVMHEWKSGTLKSGTSKKKVTSRAQAIAIAIGISEARARRAKVPAKRTPVKKRR